MRKTWLDTTASNGKNSNVPFDIIPACVCLVSACCQLFHISFTATISANVFICMFMFGNWTMWVCIHTKCEQLPSWPALPKRVCFWRFPTKWVREDFFFIFQILAWEMCCIVESVHLCARALPLSSTFPFIIFISVCVCVCVIHGISSLHLFVLYRCVDTTDTGWTWTRRQHCHFEFMVPP